MSEHNPQSYPTSDTQRSIEGPSALEWDEKKEIIRNLYEKKRLKEVRAILEREYGFKATYVLMRCVHSPIPILTSNLA